MSHRKLTLLAALALAVMGSSAQAGFISQVKVYPSGGGTATPPFTTPLTFNSFNTALGTLTAVTIKLTENGTVSSFVVNVSPGTTDTFSGASSSSAVTVTGPDGTTVTSTLATTPASGTAPYNGFMPQSTGSVSATVTATDNIGSGGFAAYESPTAGVTYTVNATAGVVTTTGSATSGSGALAFGGSSSVGGTVEIDYTFTPAVITVPEPASLGMIALGLGGVFGVSRFRRRAI